MKKGIQKLIKGILAIFLLKIILFSGVFVFQSCQKSELFNEEQNLAQARFFNIVQNDMVKLNQIDVQHLLVKEKSYLNNNGTRTMQETGTILTVYSLPGEEFTDTQEYESAATLKEISEFEEVEIGITDSDGVKSDNIEESQEVIVEYNISSEEAKSSLEPTLEEAKNYLKSKGLTDSDITNLLTADEDGPAMSESDLIPTILMLIAEEQTPSSVSSLNLLSLFGASAHASQIGECVGDALGISAVAGALAAGISSGEGKRLLKKAIRKVAGRALGWVGAAIFVYEFGDCMNWW